MEQAGGQCLLAALQINKTLTSIKLQGNSISNDLLTAIGESNLKGLRRYHTTEKYYCL